MKRGFLMTGLLSLILLVVLLRNQLDMGAVSDFISEQNHFLAPLVFVGIYAMATLLFLPGSLMTLLGGLMFGPLWGTFLNLAGATLGATLSFLAARYLAADWVERKSSGWMRKLKDGVEEEGWRFVAFVRLVPVFPFNLLNYALGLTRINLHSYVAATAVFMLPGALGYTWIGYLGGEAASGAEDLVSKLLLGVGVISVVLFVPSWYARRRRRSAGA